MTINEFNAINEQTERVVSFKDFQSRARIKVNDDGSKTNYYNRLLIGLRCDKREWLNNKGEPSDIVQCFMLGDKNIVFAFNKRSNVIYVNGNSYGTWCAPYVKYFLAEKQPNVQLVDDLPTRQITRNRAKVDSLDALLDKAAQSDIELDF